MIKTHLLFFLLPLFFFSIKASAQYQQVEEILQKWETDKSLKNAEWGVAVFDCKSQKILFGANENRSLRPASSQKTITTATALEILGEDFTFVTKLFIHGEIENGTLKGDVIIKGGGDPTLGFFRYGFGTKSKTVLNKWVAAIKAAGITKIDGNIIGDPTIFDTQLIPNNWQWEDMGNYFGAGAAGLNFHENKYEIQFSPSKKIGEQATINHTNPTITPAFELVNEVRTGEKGSGDQAVIYAAPYSTTVVVRGTVPAGQKEFTIKGAVQNPALFTAGCLLEALQKADILVSGAPLFLWQKKPQLYTSGEIIDSIVSPPLKDIVFWANRKSINLYCEALLKMMGKQKTGKGSIEKGIQTVQRFWKNRTISDRGWWYLDGSGLSPSNGISAEKMAKIMAKASQLNTFDTFDNSLSTACGKTDNGSLRGMLCKTSAAENLRAKSGYIARTRAYTGYVQNPCGELLSFAIFVNDYTCSNSQMRNKMAKLMAAFAEIQ